MNAYQDSAQFHFGLDYIREHFGSNVPLATQQITHNLYRQNPERLVDMILRCLSLDGREAILDVGCGNGFILGEVASRLRAGPRVVGVDISTDMLELAKRNTARAFVPVDLQEGRAEDLGRFAAASFDRVMANFIFHYINDPDLVCRELARVMHPHGRTLVSIEARQSMPQMYQLHFEAMERCGFPVDFVRRLSRGRRGKMVLDNAGEILARHFADVVEHPYEDALEFEAADPFMTFYAAGHRYCGAKAMAGDVVTPEMLSSLHDEVEQAVRQEIGSKGRFVLNKRNSVFVCRTPLTGH